MQFREATESDIAAMIGTFEGRNALPLEPRVRQALPAVLGRLLSSPAGTFTVFEDDGWQGPRVLSFAAGLFVCDSVIEEYLAAPCPAMLGTVLAALLDGRRPLLTLEEVRHANSGEGLRLAVFPISHGHMEWDDPKVAEIRRLAPQAFARSFGGYRLREIYYEVFTDEAATYLQGGGYRLLHDLSALAGTGFLSPESRPRMLLLTRTDLPPAAMSVASQAFDPPRAELGLTLAEQRVALRALDGASDRAIADSLGLSRETVRANWRSIYRRLSHVLAGVDATRQQGNAAARGLEKRRVAVEYLRQNLHELRPSVPPSRRGSSTRPKDR